MHSYKSALNDLFGTALSSVAGIQNSNANVITSSRPEFGDYQVNGVMSVAKQLKTNPREIAARVIDEVDLNVHPFIAKMEIAGPGFINVHLNNEKILERGNRLLRPNSLLIGKSNEPQTVVVDYSSPNLAKEMHVGHLRGTIIGDCLARVLEKTGHTVIRQNHVGDWGTQFGMLISYMQEVASDTDTGPKHLADLEVFYREAKARFDEDEEFAITARAAVVKLQSGEQEYLDAWGKFINESLTHCQAVYDTLNITLTREHLAAESFYNDELSTIMSELRSANLLEESNGAKVVFLPEFVGKEGAPLPVIIQKSDGGFLYATTDLAAVKYRSFSLNADRALYVVDARQSLHFQQVFSVAEKAGFSSDKISLEHVAYGTMMGKDGRPFKTRSGDTIKLVELLDEAVKRAFYLVSEKNPTLEEAKRHEIAKEVGISAVKYSDLSKNRTSDYVFDWASMLSFEGNTAPYLLYAYARIKSIIRKSTNPTASYNIESCNELEERNLLVKLLQYPEIVYAVVSDSYPNHLCNYLYELAGLFMRFYEACPILKEDAAIRYSRLAICVLTADTLKQGLDLLGINTLEQM
jgi:arginyl-tRNA synthetase|tara:strand:+ start:16763 stop:18502 length:1740 start_codon:yes stop_codon:yes gene_type:complete